MANDISINLNGKDNASPAINKARQSLQQFAAQSSSVENVAKRFDKIQKSSAPLKKKLKEVQMLMAQLNLQGDANSPIYNQMAQAAGEYRDAIADAAQATNMFANDTMKLQTGIDTMNVFAQAGQIATGVMALFGTENENVTLVIMQLQSVIAIANGVQSISNLLNKDSNIILRAKATWEGIVTAAKVKDTAATTINTTASIANTAATKLSTVGQMAWNVAKAVGKALLGDFSGLVLVAAAGIAMYAMATSDSTDKQEENNAEMEKSKQIYADYSSTVAKSTGEMVGKFMILRAEWNQLQTDAEKTEWLENNSNAMRDLGLEVNDVIGAENVFNKNTNAVVRALTLRAQAMAAQQAIVAEYTKYYEKLNEIDNSVAGGGYYTKASAGQEITKQEAIKAGIAINRNNFSTMHTLSEADATKVNAYRAGQARDRRESNIAQAEAELEAGVQPYLKILNNVSNQLANSPIQQYRAGSNRSSGSSKSGSSKSGSSKSGSSKSGSSGSTEKPKTPEDVARETYEELSKAASQAKEDFTKGIINEDTFKSKLNEINRTFKEKGFKGLELDPDQILKDQTIDELNTKFESVKDKFEHGEMSELDYYANVDDINKKLKEIGERPIEITVRSKYEVANSGNRDKANEAANRFSTLQSDFKLGIVGKEAVMGELDEINAILTSIGKEPIEITFNADGVEDAKEKFKELEEGILESFDGGFMSTVEELQGLKDYLELGGDAAVAAGAGMQVFGNSLQQIAGDGAAAKAGAILAAIGQLVVSFATAMTSASKNWITWLAFGITGAATLATIIAQIKGFADGGIIQGNSFHGDTMLARVNAGEMILNQNQQRNLFRMLDGGAAAGGGGGRVEFQISGTTLKGVLNNYDKKMERLR